MPITFSATEAQQRAAALTPPVQHVDRATGASTSPDEIFAGIKTRIVEALSYDYDSMYYVILHAAKYGASLAAAANFLISEIAKLVPQAQNANAPAGQAVSLRTEQLIALLDAEDTFTDKAEYVNKVAQQAQQLAKEATSSNSPMYSPEQATERLQAALAEYADTVSVLRVLVSNIEEAVSVFSVLRPENTEVARQASFGAKHLRESYDDGAHKATVAVDALLLSGLLQSAASPIDITSNKYDGAVVQGAATPAALQGNSFPRPVPYSAFPLGDACTVLVDGVYAGTITAPPSLPPELVTYVPPNLFSSTETGSIGTGTGLVFALSFFLKTYVAAGSITISYVAAGLTISVTDNGVGGWSAGAGAVSYSTGVATFTPAAAPDLGTTILCRYTYSAVGDLQVRNGAGVLTGAYPQAKCTVQNTVYSRALPISPYTSLVGLAAAMSASFVGDGVSFSTSGDSLLADAIDGGSASQLMYPVTSTPVLNPSFGAPTWSTPPTTVNDAIGASFNAGTGRAFGSDTELDDLAFVGAAAAKATLSTQRSVIASAQAASVALVAPTTVAVSVPVALGDLILVRSPVVTTHVVVGLGVGDVVVYPELPFAIDSITGLPPATTDIVFDVERAQLLVSSNSTGVDSAVAATVAGIGISGTAVGTPAAFALPTLGSKVALRTGDRVYQVGTYAFSLSSVSATSAAFTPTQTTTLPLGTVSIRGLGRDSYVSLLAGLSAARKALSRLWSSEYQDAARLFAFSGTGHKQYTEAAAAATTALATLLPLLSGYTANKTDEIDSLFSFLKEENLQPVLSLLITASIERLLLLDPSDLSAGATVEQLSSDLVSFLETDEVVDVNSVYDPLQDFFVRPTQKEYEEF